MTDIVHNDQQATQTADLLITQFKTQTNMRGLAKIFGAKIQEIEDALFQLFTLRGVNTASGAQLDILGSIVGVVRGGLNDSDYAIAIRAEILLNVSSGTVQQLLSLMYAAFPGFAFTLSESFPASFTIVASGILANPTQAGALVQSAKPAGVGAYLVYSIVPLSHTFTYCDSNLSQPVINNDLGYSTSVPSVFSSLSSGFGAVTIATAAYGNGLWLIGGLASPFLRTSSDRVTWTTQSPGFGGDVIEASTFGAGKFVIGGGSGKIATSTDGMTWTSRTSTFGADDILGLTYGGGLFAAVGNSGKIATSPDGITWTSRTSGVGTSILSVTYGGGLFLAGSTSGQLLISPDGITWTPGTTGFASSVLGVGYGNGLFLACDAGGNLVTSPDGSTWTSRSLGFGGLEAHGVTFGNSEYIVVGQKSAAVSFDGITWTPIDAAIGSETASGILFATTLFLVFGTNGILTDSVSSFGGHYAGSV